MKVPTCGPGDLCIALRAESTLFMPEIAKGTGTPKRFQHVSPFPFFEVGFIGRIVRVSFAFNLDVSFDGSALGVVQPDFIWPSFVIAGFTEEGPVTVLTPFKVFRFDPARGFVQVPSSCPLPQTREDVAIHVSKRVFAHHVPMIVRPTANFRVELIDQIGADTPCAALMILRIPSRKVPTFFLEGLMSSFPLGYLRTFCPRKSKPCSTCVMTVFVGESSSPRSCRNCSTTGDDEVIRVTDEIDTRFLSSKGPETFSCWVFSLQESFKSVQRAVSERGGDNSTLGSPIHRFVKDVFFHVPGFQPSMGRTVCFFHQTFISVVIQVTACEAP